MKGRKPLPLKLRARSEADTGELLEKAGPPRKPLWLSTMAAAEWDRIVPVLAAEGLVCDLDTIALASYCETYAQWRDALMSIESCGIITDGSQGQKRANPAIIVAREAVAMLLRLSGEFGFTPLARSRFGGTKGGGEVDNFDAWLKGTA